MADTYLTRTPSSSSNRKTFTWSGWIKRSQLGATNTLFTSGYSSNAVASLRFNASDKLDVFDYNSSTQFAVVTNRLFRDTSAWYHIVMRVDTTQSTANDRVRLYVNGEQETSLTTNTQPSQNYDTLYNGGVDYYIGRYGWTNADSFNGSMSHINFCDGQSYAPTEFGETDTTTGQWKIKTELSVTYGTNGFFILKNGNTITDQSGEGNNFTLGAGTLTNTLDCPDNVFATFNSLYKSNETLSYGNTRSVLATSDQFGGVSTIGVSSGKWYAEFKPNIAGSNYYGCGIIGDVNFSSNNNVGAGRDKSIGYRSGDGEKGVDNTFSSYGDTYTTNDIIGIALDLDSATNTITFYKNNVSQGTINITVPNPDGVWHFCACSMATGGSSDWSANFGNGYFGTSAVADNSTATASTPGTFNYDVPTGYQPLSTKGLNA